MNSIKNLSIILLLLCVNSIFAQQDSIPSYYFGLYETTFGDEGSGNELHYFIGVNGESSVVYKEIISEARYATYFKVVSFDQESGNLVLKTEKTILKEENSVIIEEDSSSIIEISFIPQGNDWIIRDENFSDIDIVKSEALEFEILNRNGIPTKLQRTFLETEKATVGLDKLNTITFAESEIELEPEFPVYIRTCMFRNIVIIDSIFGDCVDLDCYSMSYLKMMGEKQEKIELAQLFKNGGKELENLINMKSLEELQNFKDRNSDQFDERYLNSIYQNHSFIGNKLNDFYANKIFLRYINSEEQTFQFVTFVEIAESDYYQQGDGMLFTEISFKELLPYFAE